MIYLESSFPWFWLVVLLTATLAVAYLKRGALPRRRLYGSIALRMIIIVIVMVAIANPIYESSQDGSQSVLFLFDQSGSISERGAERAMSVMRDIRRLQSDGDTAGMVAFARTPHRVVPPTDDFTVQIPSVPFDPDATDIATPLELSLSLFPDVSVRSVVLLSDGNETIRQARSVADVAKRLGVMVHTVPLDREMRNAWGIEKLHAPSRVRINERFRIRGLLQNASAAATAVRVVFRRDGAPISAQDQVLLHPGATPVTVDYKLPEPGLYAFDLEVTHNDGIKSVTPPVFIDAVDQPRVLIVSPDARGRNFFGEVMRNRPFGIDERAALPARLDSLLQYDCIVLNDVDRQRLPDTAIYALQQYVQDFGGGLVTIGGGAESSLEEFASTPLEDLLPVELATKRTLEKKRNDFVLLLLIDRSGSMKGEKIEMAKASAINAVEELEPGDSIGIIAFDDEAHWIVDLTVLGEDKTKITDDIRRLTTGGGTDARMALVEAFRLFQSRKINIRKHIILMTDGITTRRQLLDITRRVAEKDITVSTIAIGDDSDLEILDHMRQIGRGSFHVITNFSELPRIVVGDMGEQVKNADDIEERFTPQIFHQSQMISGIDQREIPSLKGYVTSTLKTAATKPLMTNFRNAEEPILAHWYYGLGRSTVITAGVNGAWSDEWLRWRNFGRLWEQIIRWTMRPQTGHDYFFHIRREAGRLRMQVEIEADEETLPATLRGALRLQNDRQVVASLSRIGRNVFEGDFAVADSGVAQLALVEEGGSSSSIWTGRVYVPGMPSSQSISPEIDGAPPNYALLQDIARITAGVYDPSPEEVIVPPQTTVVTRNIRDYLLIMALLAFLAEVALRRVDIPYRAILVYARRTRYRLIHSLRRHFDFNAS